MHKIVIASDSFKGSMSAKQACRAIEKGFDQVWGNKYESILIPMADGGEGSVTILQETCDTKMVFLDGVDSLGRKMEATFAFDEKEKVAYLESAKCCGLTLIKECEQDIMKHSSYGIGVMLLHAKALGAKEIILGLGGTGTNDGGFGLICALAGVPVASCLHVSSARELAQQNLELAQASLQGVRLMVACDVTNTYIGDKGATRVFAKQKGASPREIELLEQQLTNFSSFVEKKSGTLLANMLHSGAAGGIAGACYTIGGKLVSGVDLILERTKFEEHIKHATCIISGEGSIDSQSIDGKTISGICKLAKKHKIPVIGLAGRLGKETEELYQMGLVSMFSITSEAKTLKQALEDGESSLRQTSENVARLMNAFCFKEQ